MLGSSIDEEKEEEEKNIDLEISNGTKSKSCESISCHEEYCIIEEKVKPVLKNLLKLDDKNWELIEEENIYIYISFPL
ncbi:hypothetical protein LOK49_LG06G00906 [Camellia lanceoleosa]|uniref:Uncharacterized protein n=1 Tax=Camellia lanceoleosa TaxID=1840588 RepID=A0ACC0H9Z6_9ERIC|nr:hypothetical protein LOK49_LG06G00906 [Camellia lanceoleosa]